MKKLLNIFLVIIYFPVLCNAQVMEVVERAKKIYIANTPFDYSDSHCYGADCYFEIPYLPNYKNYFAKNVKYPVVCEENGIQGDVYVNFFVERDGSISNVNLERGVDPALDKEALRFVNNMPRWIPGKCDGKVVRTNYTLRVTFKIGESNYLGNGFDKDEKETFDRAKAQVKEKDTNNTIEEIKKYIELGDKEIRNGQSGLDYYKKADKLFEEVASQNGNDFNTLNWWLSLKIKMQDVVGGKPIAEKIFTMLEQQSIETNETMLISKLLSCVVLHGYYYTNSNSQDKTKIYRSKVIETAHTILKINPNNGLAKGLLSENEFKE